MSVFLMLRMQKVKELLIDRPAHAGHATTVHFCTVCTADTAVPDNLETGRQHHLSISLCRDSNTDPHDRGRLLLHAAFTQQLYILCTGARSVEAAVILVSISNG